VIDGATGSTEVAKTSDSDVLSSGIFVDGVGITSGLGAGGYLAGNGFVQIVGDAGPGDSVAGTDVVLDDSFSAVEFFSQQFAVGPNNQVALIGSNGELLLVDSNGQPVTSFGDSGQIDLPSIIEPLTGLDLATVTALQTRSYSFPILLESNQLLISTDALSFSVPMRRTCLPTRILLCLD